MRCDECKLEKPLHTFYAKDGSEQVASLVLTNSTGAWRKVVCHDCFYEFQSRAFCAVSRKDNTFTASCAF